MKNSSLELVVAGTSQGVLMVESEANQLSEEQMLEAVLLGQETYKEVINAIISLAKKAAKQPWEIAEKNSGHLTGVVKSSYITVPGIL